MYEDEEQEANVYGHDAREDLVENDELDPEEGAFMEGYDSDYEEEDEDDSQDESEEEDLDTE